MGGVENHIYLLSHCLLSLGHRVCVVTHSYKERCGVRYLRNGLKVYYLPVPLLHQQISLPSLICSFPLLRNVFIRESVTIVHGHSSCSSLGLEAIFHGITMGLKTVFTDHSLFDFDDISSILINKLLTLTLCNISHVICVSHTSKENTVIRGSIEPHLVSVIPNSVDSFIFTPADTWPSLDKIIIIVCCRLVYRKGIKLLIQVIPIICSLYPNVYFFIGGDGPLRIQLEEVREKHQIQERVKMFGQLNHEDIRNFLIKGHIFLNTSLIEAFCMAILEAASCGLFIVSTDVGAIPEVLPAYSKTFFPNGVSNSKFPSSFSLSVETKRPLIKLAAPKKDALVNAIVFAIENLPFHDPNMSHQCVKQSYSWDNVALRTEKIYDTIAMKSSVSFETLLNQFNQRGTVSGKLFCVLFIINNFFLLLLNYFCSSKTIEKCPKLILPQKETSNRKFK